MDRDILDIETRSAAQPTSWDLMRTGVDGGSDAGIYVSPYLAENLSAVFGAVQVISESVATLPCIVYRLEGDRVRSAAPGHPVSKLLSDQPNELQTAPEFIEMMTAHCLLRGNSFAEIIRDGRGQPIELVPLHPDWISIVTFAGSRRIAYDVSDPYGSTRRLLAEEMLHLKDRSDDGIIGKSRLQRARETFATSIATSASLARHSEMAHRSPACSRTQVDWALRRTGICVRASSESTRALAMLGASGFSRKALSGRQSV